MNSMAYSLTLAFRASIGAWLDRTSARLEAAFCGLHRDQVTIDDSVLSVYLGKKKRKAILLLHGLTGSKRVWIRFAKRFTRDYYVIVPDLPGHGDTDFGHGLDHQIAANCRRITQMLEVLGVTSVHLAGSSMGGFIGTQLALDHPGLVNSLALFAPAGVSSPEASDLDLMIARGRNPFVVRNRADYDSFFELIMSKPPFTPSVVKDHFARQYERASDKISQMFDAYASSTKLNGRLCDVSVPTFVVWGAEDKVLHPRCIEGWKAGIPHAAAEVWHGVGHMPVLEQPVRAAESFGKFLQSTQI